LLFILVFSKEAKGGQTLSIALCTTNQSFKAFIGTSGKTGFNFYSSYNKQPPAWAELFLTPPNGNFNNFFFQNLPSGLQFPWEAGKSNRAKNRYGNITSCK